MDELRQRMAQDLFPGSVEQLAQSEMETNQAPMKPIEQQAQDYAEYEEIAEDVVEHQALVKINEQPAQSN
ncbi:hypothetical protein F511_11640 [Dorcoceras hygrometricum]|uniref:Uncharacterized protein n=1 Tax=Dorcoceras hygrometricum TaxID=472368 RepID=A0A2Z7ASD9_9LAMI|nr:hypothetical protein F511_11640 [Dorcoceras hygrometricum]